MVILLRFSSQVIIKLGTFPRIKHLTRILRLQKPCFRRQPDHKAVKNYELALAALSENGLDEGVQRRYTQAEEAMNKQDAWTADTNAKIILQKLGIPTLERK